MPNPFFYGGHVNPEQFVGRRAELARIFTGLEVAHTGQMQSFSVVGPRRIGKSSLLFYAANRYASHLHDATQYRFAYIDLQDAATLTLDGLLKKILKELEFERRIPNLTLAKFQDAIIALKEGGASPVILLDEFEQVMDHASVSAPDIFDSWRYLMNANAAAFITASKTPLNELAEQQKFTSPFFNVFTYVQLGELADDEARELIARGADCDRAFTPTEQNEALLLAGKHPYKLQLAGSLLYQAKADNRAVDWAELRKQFVVQLKQVGLEVDTVRMLKTTAQKSKGTVISGIRAAVKGLFDAWIDSMSKPH